MMIDDEDIDEFYVVQWINEPYILQVDKYMRGNEPPIKAYTCDITCGVGFLNPVSNAKI